MSFHIPLGPGVGGRREERASATPESLGTMWTLQLIADMGCTAFPQIHRGKALTSKWMVLRGEVFRSSGVDEVRRVEPPG